MSNTCPCQEVPFTLSLLPFQMYGKILVTLPRTGFTRRVVFVRPTGTSPSLTIQVRMSNLVPTIRPSRKESGVLSSFPKYGDPGTYNESQWLSFVKCLRIPLKDYLYRTELSLCGDFRRKRRVELKFFFRSR